MTIKEFETKYKVKLVNKKDSKFMRFLGFVLKPFTPDFMTRFFTTIRLPFGEPSIYYPDGLEPMRYEHTVLEHELMHVNQQRTGWGLFKSYIYGTVFPLPLFFSGRWWIERDPYLADIKKKLLTVDQAVDILWASYGFVWPKGLMKKWFEKNL